MYLQILYCHTTSQPLIITFAVLGFMTVNSEWASPMAITGRNNNTQRGYFQDLGHNIRENHLESDHGSLDYVPTTRQSGCGAAGLSVAIIRIALYRSEYV